MKDFKKVVKLLTEKNMTIATMESCTGGGVVNALTCIEGASDVIKFSAVTYSNEFKIKMGVDKNIIDTYSVYSIETAESMAYNISKFASSTIGVGITGKLNRVDKNNLFSNDNEVFVCIYFNNEYHNFSLIVDRKTRKENKELVIEAIINKLEELLTI